MTGSCVVFYLCAVTLLLLNGRYRFIDRTKASIVSCFSKKEESDEADERETEAKGDAGNKQEESEQYPTARPLMQETETQHKEGLFDI